MGDHKGDIVGWLRHRQNQELVCMGGQLAGEIADHIEKLQSRKDDENVYVDENGTVWNRPTAWAYAMACKAVDKWRNSCRDWQERCNREYAARMNAEKELKEAQQDADKVDARAIGEILIDAKGHPYARLRTGYDAEGNQWAGGTKIYAAQPDPAMAGDAWLAELIYMIDLCYSREEIIEHARKRVQPASEEDAK